MVSPLQTGDFDRKCAPIRKGQRITCDQRLRGKNEKGKQNLCKDFTSLCTQGELIRFSGKNENKAKQKSDKKILISSSREPRSILDFRCYLLVFNSLRLFVVCICFVHLVSVNSVIPKNCDIIFISSQTRAVSNGSF